MAKPREKLSSQADPELLAALREDAQGEGRQFQAVLQGARMERVFGGVRFDVVAYGKMRGGARGSRGYDWGVIHKSFHIRMNGNRAWIKID